MLGFNVYKLIGSLKLRYRFEQSDYPPVRQPSGAHLTAAMGDRWSTYLENDLQIVRVVQTIRTLRKFLFYLLFKNADSKIIKASILKLLAEMLLSLFWL